MTDLARMLLVSAFCVSAASCAGATENDVLSPLAVEPAATPQSDEAAEPAAPDAKPKARDAKKTDDPKKGNGDDKPNVDEPDCDVEREENGSESKANKLTSATCIRGTISGSSDKDYFRIAVERDGRLLIGHKERNGRVQYKVTEENGNIVTGLSETFTDRAPDIAVEANKAYFFLVTVPDLTGPGAGPRSYELTVTAP